jgi:hypothetical protein
MIEVPIPPEPVKVILESYLAVLEASTTPPIFHPFLAFSSSLSFGSFRMQASAI